ncbi:hypothetical protein [Streptomyces sp. CBMA370]|uniref:hypothetical protein n=1 Tax=Streptomyces sp. CBMA370 TaxID=1930278 RepID=UPI001662025F|nr:hypothetical protein [Streptomyces sp. CBMA370]MBD0712565.1 hypothetical protein [Streptomyces sp. CBMA370]
MSTATEPKVFVSFVGKGKVTHGIVQGQDVTLCGKPSAGAIDASGQRPDPAIACKACAKKAFFFNAPKLSEIDRDTIPGLGKNARPATEDKEAPVMAETTTAPDTRDAQVEEIRASLERLPSLIIEGNTEGADTLKTEIETAISALKGKGVAALKAQLRKERGEKIEAAEKEAAEADKPSTAVATLETSAEVAASDEEIKKLIAKGNERVKALAVNKFKGGHEIAEIIFDIRRRIKTADGYLDLNADTDAGRKESGKVYDALLEGLPEEGEDEAADAIRAEIGSIRKGARNAMVDVRANYLKSLDNSPEEAALWQHALDAAPELKPSEAVAQFHKFELRTRAEIAKENRQAKALAEARRKELAAKVEAGELSEEDAAAELEGSEDGEKSEKEKATDAIEKLKKSAVRLAKNAKKITDENEREDILEALTAALAEIRKTIKD